MHFCLASRLMARAISCLFGMVRSAIVSSPLKNARFILSANPEPRTCNRLVHCNSLVSAFRCLSWRIFRASKALLVAELIPDSDDVSRLLFEPVMRLDKDLLREKRFQIPIFRWKN